MEYVISRRNDRLFTRTLTFAMNLLLYSNVIGFNINTNFPDIYSEPTKNSAFGFSVAQFVINDSKWLIVGAPFAEGTSTPDGAVYRCDDGKCTEMTFNRYTPYGGNASYSMIGASITASSQDGFVITCAPRYSYYDKLDPFTDDDDAIYMMGACFVYNGTADTYKRKPYTPCMPGVVGIKTENTRCAAGFSVSVIRGEDSFVVGGIGTAQYKGQYIRMKLFSRTSPDYGLLGASVGDYSGYSVETGNFSGQTIFDMVSGAPRGSDHLGQVSIYIRRLPDGWGELLTLYGQQFGEYYGSVLAVGDLNGDHLDDLVVGAPFHANEDQRIADVGKVYIYYQASHASRQGVFRADVTELSGSRHLGGRFGFAMALLKDINQDGYNDLAVGAPLEGASGVVYIFLGSNKGVNSVPVQVIHGRDVAEQLSGFGSALVGTEDMTNNGYPDLLVGSPASGHVVLLKSQPVVTVDIGLISDVTKIKLDDLGCDALLPPSAVTCFYLNTTITYAGKRVPDIMSIQLTWDLDLDNHTQSGSIVLFSESGRNNQATNFTETLPLTRNVSVSKQHRIYSTNAIIEHLQPIRMQVTYKLTQESHNLLDSVLDMSVPHSKITQVELYRPPADLTFHVESTVPHAVLGVGQLVELNITVVNLENVPCYNAEISIDLPIGIIYSGLKGPKTVACVVPENRRRTVICSMGFRFPPETKMDFIVRTSIKDLHPLINMTSMTYSLNLTSVNDMNSSNNAGSLLMDLAADVVIEISGASSPDQLQVIEDASPQNVTHVVELTNHGPSPLVSMEIWIIWPVMTEDNIPLLMPTGNPVVSDDKGHCHAEEHHLKPLAMLELAACNTAMPYFLCQKIHCTTDFMDSGASIVINVTSTISPHIIQLSKLDNSLLLNSTVRASGESFPNVPTSGRLIHSVVIGTRIVFPGVTREEKVAWWVIAVAVVSGVVLLIVIVVALGKLGFFRRNTREQLHSAKRESANFNWPQENDEDDDDDKEDGDIYPFEEREGDAGSDNVGEDDSMKNNSVENNNFDIPKIT